MNFLISSSPRKVIDCPHVPQTFSSFNSSMSPPVEERHYLILAKDLLPLGNFNTPPSINWPYQTTQYKVMPFSIYCITPPPTTWPIGHTWPFGHTYAYTHIYASTTTDVIFGFPIPQHHGHLLTSYLQMKHPMTKLKMKQAWQK